MLDGWFNALKKAWNRGYIGLEPRLVDVIETLRIDAKVRVIGKTGESYVGYLFDPMLLAIKFNARLDHSTATYTIWYGDIQDIQPYYPYFILISQKIKEK
ncbi:MAG: hypothetical protein GW780_00275 [Candidatus Aenigmarchaeota archaeon]|nr:hypothetical protein [Candidatus Aenigmarchaeota archaeon]OIN85798.1 MAG: hypothetical protein AUJ50_04600 [Candidatus Aenigmarchaeota archaeon CG1_02_38_14]PIV69506.1 MAG: hypothetical protein COS07_00520 [Candidatus Aenigmarchaeota archaeon CG01_land_8_20_14_3_00_37_9]PIW41787.1 MAG: hypothetical protein COW21_00110 [Candidatus Aenigmarchaeota archaeon CG15_BIG_FIL_POST_REV_8_21_14_020_37_27]PIX50736.1 MAG: hypothetical protein COZ52_02585 [Candidatus Aenigmarchaeota archaeon CG_4_8_14_3_u